MTTRILKAALVASTAFLIASAASAGGITLTDKQMDTVAAGGVERVDGFVCPVISGAGVQTNDKFFAIGDGYYSFHGPDVSVPVHATNNAGAGRPGGSFASPGDANYSAIWGFRPPS